MSPLIRNFVLAAALLAAGIILVPSQSQAACPAGNTGPCAPASGDATISNTGVVSVLSTNGVAFGTASSKNTGTLGATIGLLNGNNTYSGISNFTGTFEVAGVTVTFPSSGSLAGTTDSQTLTNKTLTSPTINSGTINGSFSGTPTWTGVPIYSGLSSGTQVSCLGLDSGNHVVLNLASCGTGGGGGGSLELTDGTHDLTGVTKITTSAGLLVGGTTPNATLSPINTATIHPTSGTAANIGGQDDYNGASLTSTLSPLAAGQTNFISNQGNSTLNIGLNSQTVNGVPSSTVIHKYGFAGYVGLGGGIIDAFEFPGFDTITTNALVKFSDASGALTASTIVDNTFGVVAGAATGGPQGAGTVNATGLFINGVAVGTASGCTVSGSHFQVLVVNSGATGCDPSPSASINLGALTLGASGTVGTVTMGNATSGTLKLQATTGALGTAVQSFQATSGLVADLDVADQLVTGGANWTTLGQTTGNITVDCGARPGQYIANTGAFTITAPTTDGSCTFDIENGASAGAVSVSGFSPNSIGGAALDTTNGHIFRIVVIRNHAHSSAYAVALQ